VSGTSDFVLFLGRFHPLLVHLPIGLVLLLAAIELLARFPKFKQANSHVGFILALAVPAAGVAAMCGWLLSLGGGYQDQLLQLHKWTGIGTAVACAIAGLLYSLNWKTAYRVCLFSSVALLTVAGHYGGSLTHGSDYFARYAPAPLRPLLGGSSKKVQTTAPPQTNVVDVTQLPVYAGVIRPVLEQNCLSCHGPEKSKGGLRLDSLEGISKGGKAGPALIAGKAAESDLVKRIHLPANDDDHMPPDGKPQPSRDDIALLEWWINAGAPGDKKVGELKPTPRVMQALAARFGMPAPIAKKAEPKPLQEVQAQAGALSDELGIAITALSPQEPWLQCNASIAGTNFGDAQFSKLKSLGANLRWLDLAGTAVTDGGLTNLAAAPNLTRLHLERTGLTDAGLSQVAALSDLEYLNLYGTAVTDEGLNQLETMSKLKQLYLWQTKVTPAAGKAFAEARIDKDQLQRWQEEIEQLNAKIRDAHISVDLGTMAPKPTAVSTNAAAVNTMCPVSGKPIDPSKTVLYEGLLVAFCCDDCKATFEKDPTPYLAKLDHQKESQPTTK
jgi:uncharacterized membrane protein/mono/diheme cytochrome c family protein/YHS domain-containing protein